MLILSRKPGERIFIGDDIVVEFKGMNAHGEAVLGFVAPVNITVLREELAARMAQDVVAKLRRRKGQADDGETGEL